MIQPGCLALLSDFGLSDPYVGIMKGVIAQINPHLTVIDLTHQIPPQNVAFARFALMTAYPYFPTGTVYVAVVDPGVGSHRRAIAIATGTNPAQPSGILVGPDNGLFSGVLSQNPVIAAVELTRSEYWRTPEPSSTFHGRDIFAPVGAHLASGVALEALGAAIAPDTLVNLSPPAVQIEKLDNGTTVITGVIQATDHFGNLITNISAAEVFETEWVVLIGDLEIPGHQTYSNASVGELLALVGSHGWVEIAVNRGNAQARLRLNEGDGVRVVGRMKGERKKGREIQSPESRNQN
jgi:S-adenosylmethionine hydrolase